MSAVEAQSASVRLRAHHRRDPDGFIPRLHTLHFNITNSCNLSCSFCYINAAKGKTTDLPLEVVRQLAVDAAEAGAVRVILSGGEPLMRKDWFDVFGAFASNGFRLSIVSNGTLMKDAVIERFEAFTDLEVLISLDGDIEAHDEIRGQAGAHHKTVEAIRRFTDAGVHVQVNATILKRNLGEAAYFTRLSRDLDVSVRLSLLNPFNGRGTKVADEALDLDQILQLREYCHEVRARGSRVFINLPPLLQHPEDVIPIRSPACGWTRSFCGVTHDGNVTICGVAGTVPELYAGNILERRFAEIWRDAPLFVHLRSLEIDDLQGVCGRCPVRHACGGACRLSGYMGSGGDFTAPYGMCEAFFRSGHIPDEVLDPVPVDC